MTALQSWSEFYLDMARQVATRSKDPSTRVGSVIVRADKTIASLGFNGFPRGVADTPARYADREFKYPAVVHAELNAILNAREPLVGSTLFCTFHPCARCASAIVQSGITCVVIPPDPVPERWKADTDIATVILVEGGVSLVTVP